MIIIVSITRKKTDRKTDGRERGREGGRERRKQGRKEKMPPKIPNNRNNIVVSFKEIILIKEQLSDQTILVKHKLLSLQPKVQSLLLLFSLHRTNCA